MLTVTAGKTCTLTFTYKATSQLEAFFLCQIPTTQAYNKRVVCDASSALKTVSFEVGPIPSATGNWFTLRFNRLNTVTIDNISLAPVGSTNPNPTPSPTPTPTPTPAPVSNLITNGDFESGTAGWILYLVKNRATLTTITEGTMSGMMTVTSYTVKEPGGYVCLQHPYTPKTGATYKATFTYKSTADFSVFILCQGGAVAYYRMLSCPASSQWKTVSFVTGALPSAPRNWIDFRFYSTGTLSWTLSQWWNRADSL